MKHHAASEELENQVVAGTFPPVARSIFSMVFRPGRFAPESISAKYEREIPILLAMSAWVERGSLCMKS